MCFTLGKPSSKIGNFDGLEELPPRPRFPQRHSHPFQKLYILLLLVFIGAICGLTYHQTVSNNFLRIYYGVDSWGNVCGIGSNNPVANAELSGLNMTQQPFLLDTSYSYHEAVMDPGRYFERVREKKSLCVAKCPSEPISCVELVGQNYQNLKMDEKVKMCNMPFGFFLPHETKGNRCIPNHIIKLKPLDNTQNQENLLNHANPTTTSTTVQKLDSLENQETDIVKDSVKMNPTKLSPKKEENGFGPVSNFLEVFSRYLVLSIKNYYLFGAKVIGYFCAIVSLLVIVFVLAPQLVMITLCTVTTLFTFYLMTLVITIEAVYMKVTKPNRFYGVRLSKIEVAPVSNSVHQWLSSLKTQEHLNFEFKLLPLPVFTDFNHMPDSIFIKRFSAPVVILMFFVLIFIYHGIWSTRKRITNVCKLVRQARKVLVEMPGIILHLIVYVALMMGSLVWFLYVVIMITYPKIEHVNSDGTVVYTSDESWWTFAQLCSAVLALFWLLNFFSACHQVVVSRVFCYWVFHKSDPKRFTISRVFPTMKPFCEMFSFSLGTVLIGSIVLVPMQFIKVPIRFVYRHLPTTKKSSVTKPFQILSKFVQMFDTKSYISTAIYNDTFLQGGNRAHSLIKENASHYLTVGRSIGYMLFTLNYTVLLTSLIGSHFWFYLNYGDSIYFVQVALPCLFISLICVTVSNAFFGTLATGVRTFYLLYCDDQSANNGKDKPFYSGEEIRLIFTRRSVRRKLKSQRSEKYLADNDVDAENIESGIVNPNSSHAKTSTILSPDTVIIESDFLKFLERSAIPPPKAFI